MRTLSKGRLLLAENGGNVDIVTFGGPGGLTANIRTIKEDVDGVTAVTVVHGVAWAAEGKLRYWEDTRFMGKDPGPFKLIAIPLSKD